MLIFDLESDGLLPEHTRIHCLWIYEPMTVNFSHAQIGQSVCPAWACFGLGDMWKRMLNK